MSRLCSLQAAGQSPAKKRKAPGKQLWTPEMEQMSVQVQQLSEEKVRVVLQPQLCHALARHSAAAYLLVYLLAACSVEV